MVIVLFTMGDQTAGAVLDAIFRITEITAAFVPKGIQRAVAKQAAKILTITLVSREVFACFILKKLVVFHRRSLFSFAIIL